MSSSLWFLILGGLLLTRGMTFSMIQRLPVTSSILYLAVGLVIGPTVLGAFHFNPLEQSALLKVFTEVAVLLSLFAAGIKMPVPFSFRLWRAPMSLAFLSMALTVFMMAGLAYWALGLSLGGAILLGAVLAPTDPVLATDVQVRHPGDRDRLRFNLTCEAGMNDGSAFPFVMLGLGLLGLHDLGDNGLRWLLVDVLWATLAAVVIGWLCGVAVARLGWWLRSPPNPHRLIDDFLGLGLIGIVYGISETVHAWGFLAVFFAAVALRQTDLHLYHTDPKPHARLQDERLDQDGTGRLAASSRVGSKVPIVSEGSLIFKEQLERLSELALVLLVGGSLFLDSWSWRAVGVATCLFLVIRPLSVLLGFLGSKESWRIRGMAGWFGVRGIGSLYYLMYAIEQGVPEPLAVELIHITLMVITLSILVHGISVKPLMQRYWE